MPKSMKSIFYWGMITLMISLVVGYYINELSRVQSYYIGAALLIYFVILVTLIKEKIEMIKLEHEVDLMLKEKDIIEKNKK